MGTATDIRGAPLERPAEGRAERIAAVGYDYASRPKERIDECNLCGSRTHAEVSRRDRYGFEMASRVCLRCGLCFASPRLTPEEYAELYRGTYRRLVSAFHGRDVDAASIQDEQRTYAHEVAGFLDRALPVDAPRATIMDVGGSTGIVAAAVAPPGGARITVLDPAPDELAVAEGAGMEVVAGSLEDFDAGGRTWDLVLLCQTVEHLLDVSAAMRAIRAMLAPGGHAYVDIADLAFLIRRYGSLEGALKIDHAFYLTASTARAYFARAGLEVAAEHVFDGDGWGFLLRAGEPSEPDWDALAAGAERLVHTIRELRVGAR